MGRGEAPKSIANAASEAEPVGVVACGDQQLRGGHSRDPSGLHESRVHCVDELCEVGVVTGDLNIELLIAGGEALECRAGPGRDLVVTDTCTGACQACDQAARGQVTELGSDALRSSHDQRFELHDHLGSCFHRAAPGRVGDPDRFHDAGASLRGHGVVVRQRDVRGGVGIDLVGLAAHPPHLPCRADHLDDLDARLMQVPGQARPVRVRALHTGAQQSPVAGDEALKRAVAGVGGGELGGAEVFPGDGDHGRVVRVLVRVHPRDDQRLIVHGVLPFVRVSEWEVPAGRADKTLTRPGRRGQAPMRSCPPGRHFSTAQARQIKAKTDPSRGRQSS